MRQAVIMAGGAGTRLWPLSLKARPKHLMRILEGKSLLRLSFERLSGWLPPENIHIITAEAHLPLVREEIPEVPETNLIGEPCARDTVNAVGMSAHLLYGRDPDGTMGVFTADHIIRPINKFQASVQRGFDMAERYPGVLVTFGIKPAYPHTGFGYVHTGETIENGVHEVVQFREKPSLDVARQYVASGEYFWNSGMFVWKTATFLEQLARHMPDSHEKLGRIAAAGGDDRKRLLYELYPTLQRISVDFAVMEKADRVIVVDMPCEWLDVGSWTALTEVLEPDEEGNLRVGAEHRTLDADDNILIAENDHLIAAIGVQDIVVVAGPKATLVCHRDDVQRIKELVAGLEADGMTEYL